MSSITPTNLLPTNSLGDVASLARGRPADKDRIAQVATDFESLFASQILKEMRKTLDSEMMFGGDSGDVYGGMFDQFLGQQMAQNGGFGLAKMLRETLPRTGQFPAISDMTQPLVNQPEALVRANA